MSLFVVVLCFGHGVCIEPTNWVEQHVVIDRLYHDMWGDESHRNTCRNGLFSSCAPWVYDA